MRQGLALLRKEVAEDLFAARGVVLLVVATVVLTAYSVLLVSVTELSLLDNAEAVYRLMGIALGLAGLAAAVRGSDGFAGERERGTLESLLMTPATSLSLARAKLLGAVFASLAVLLAALPYLWAVMASGQELLAPLASFAVCGALLAFTVGGFSLAVSAKVRSIRTSLGTCLAVLLLLCSPLFLGASLRQGAIGRALDWANPVALALNTLDSVVIDHQGFAVQAPRLAVLALYAIAAAATLALAARRVDP